MHAKCLDLFNDILVKKEGKVKCLDVGSGSGYLVSCLAHICCEKGGFVYGLEIIPQLVTQAKDNLNKCKKCKQWIKLVIYKNY